MIDDNRPDEQNTPCSWANRLVRRLRFLRTGHAAESEAAGVQTPTGTKNTLQDDRRDNIEVRRRDWEHVIRMVIKIQVFFVFFCVFLEHD